MSRLPSILVGAKLGGVATESAFAGAPMLGSTPASPRAVLIHQLTDEISGDAEQQDSVDTTQPRFAEPSAGTHADRRRDQDGGIIAAKIARST